MQDSSAYHWEDVSCRRCPQFAKFNVVRASPSGEGGILIVGEAPGKNENDKREGFIGEAGVNLKNLLREVGLSDRDFGFANICRCRPDEHNRRPTRQEVETCLPFLVSLIQETRPKVILAVGGRTAAHVLCGPGTLTKLIDDRAATHDWSGRNTRSTFQLIKPVVAKVPYVVPMPHTSPRVMNNEKWKAHAIRQVGLAVELWKR